MEQSYYFSTILNSILNLFYSIYNVSGKIYSYFTQPIAVTLRDIIVDLRTLSGSDGLANFLQSVLSDDVLTTIFGNYSFLEFMFGGAIVFFIFWTLLKWVLDIVF